MKNIENKYVQNVWSTPIYGFPQIWLLKYTGDHTGQISDLFLLQLGGWWVGEV